MTAALSSYGVAIADIASAVAFIMGLKLLGRVRSAPRGVSLLGAGFLLALLGAGFETAGMHLALALVGVVAGVLLGLFLGFRTSIGLGPSAGPWLAAAGGSAAVLLGLAAFCNGPQWPGRDATSEAVANPMALGDGLRGAAVGLAVLAGAFALLFGVLAGIGPAARRASQPALVALSASASGLAAAMMGFALGNPIVVTVGGLMTTAGYALADIVAKASGTRPLDLVFAGRQPPRGDYMEVKSCGPEEAAMVLEPARKVMLVPGYGMAVAQAQHALVEVAKALQARGASVLYAIHPSAGLIPGHMNILLDEAKVDVAQMVDWARANRELADADVALVVGGNDIVNPGAESDPHSAVFGMPCIDVGRAASVFVIKRSLRPGAAGVKNPLFERANVTMVFGDAKKVLQAIVLQLKSLKSNQAAA